MWKPLEKPSDREWREFKRDFLKKARFLVDECLGDEVAQIIREQGYNCVYVGEVGLLERDDTDIFAYAWREDRILLTHDRDFLDRRRFPDHRNPGVVVLPEASGSTSGLEIELARLIVILAPFREAQRHQRIEISDDGAWTIYAPTGRRRVRFGRKGRVEVWHHNGE